MGAGTSGSVILKEMTTSSLVNGCVVCFVDDDKNKAGKFLNGVPVAGNRNDIPRLAAEYKIDEIYIAIPSASAKERKAIIEICRETGCQVKILPGIYQPVSYTHLDVYKRQEKSKEAGMTGRLSGWAMPSSVYIPKLKVELAKYMHDNDLKPEDVLSKEFLDNFTAEHMPVKADFQIAGEGLDHYYMLILEDIFY